MSWRVQLVEIEVPDRDVEAVLDCLRSGWLTMGPLTEQLESEFASYVGSRHAVAVASGTAAIHLALLAAGVGPGDEVIVPSLSFVACAHCAAYLGATPVLCELSGVDDLNLDVADVEARITPRTKAILAVHMFGYPADVLALRELCDSRGIALVEDCAQAIGARLDSSGRRTGTAGHLAAYSLFSKEQLCVGEGGMIATNDEALASRLRSVRSHAMTSLTWERHRGHSVGYDVTEVGFNYRMDEPRAALALSRLDRLEADIERRRAVARAYRERLAGVDGLGLVWDEDAVERASHFAFPVILPDRTRRDGLRAELADRGIQTTWYPAIHSLSEYRALGEPLPRTEEVAGRHCTLPIFASLEEEGVELVASEVRGALGAL